MPRRRVKDVAYDEDDHADDDDGYWDSDDDYEVADTYNYSRGGTSHGDDATRPASTYITDSHTRSKMTAQSTPADDDKAAVYDPLGNFAQIRAKCKAKGKPQGTSSSPPSQGRGGKVNPGTGGASTDNPRNSTKQLTSTETSKQSGEQKFSRAAASSSSSGKGTALGTRETSKKQDNLHLGPSKSAPSPTEDQNLGSPLAPTKRNYSLCVVGHVDAGKSTLVGQLLVMLGAVEARTVAKLRQEAQQAGKGSFALAWLLDEGTEERARGVTVDVCVKHCSLPSRRHITILDAPGHKDFVPNMIRAAMEADVALLVVDASNFDAGFQGGGQTKEHIQLVRGLGILHMIVTVNKMDTVQWREDRYRYIKTSLTSFLVEECGFDEVNIAFLPIAAYSGINLRDHTPSDNNASSSATEPLPTELKRWWKDGPSLVTLLDGVELDPCNTPDPSVLVGVVTDVWKGGASSSTIQGSLYLQTGSIGVGDRVGVLPSNETAEVRHVTWRGVEVQRSSSDATHIDTVAFHGCSDIIAGSIITYNPSTVCVASRLTAYAKILELDIPIVKGQQVTLQLHAMTVAATIVNFARAPSQFQQHHFDDTNTNDDSKDAIKNILSDRTSQRLRCLDTADEAFINLQLDQSVPIALTSPQQRQHHQSISEETAASQHRPRTIARRKNFTTMLVLRDRGKSIAVGFVIKTTPSSSMIPK